MAKVKVTKLDERVFEVSIPGRNGIAVRAEDGWDLSPGIRKEEKAILKRIAEISTPQAEPEGTNRRPPKEYKE